MDPESSYAKARGHVKFRHEGSLDLFDALNISVGKLGRWTEDDIAENGGQQGDEGDGSVGADLHRELRTNFQLPNAEYLNNRDPEAPEFTKALADFHSSTRIFSDTFRGKTGPFENVVYKWSDIVALGRVCNEFPDEAKILAESEPSSAQISALFLQYFLSPLFSSATAQPGSLNNPNGPVTYQADRCWAFDIFPRKRDNGDLRAYTPKNDFCLWYHQNLCPFLIGEIVSNAKTREDRNRMIVQGIAIARAGKVLAEGGPFVLMAIYVSEKFVATRFLLQVNESESKQGVVDIYEQDYNLLKPKQAVNFLRELFNWRTYAAWREFPTMRDLSLPELRCFLNDLGGIHSKF